MSPRSLHILIVEDLPEDAELLALTLETAQIVSTCEITDTLKGLEQLLQQQDWDVVLADYRLRGFTAYEVLEVLHRSQQQIPLILVTGSLGEEAAVDCIKAGMTDYVLKDRLFRLPMVLERSLREFELKRQQQAFTLQLQQQARQEQLLNQIGRVLNSSLDPTFLLQEIVRLIGESFQVDRAIIFALEQEQVEARTEWLSNPEFPSLVGFKADIDDWYDIVPVPEAYEEEYVFHEPDFRRLPATPGRVQQITQGQVRSVLSVPIFIQDRFFGELGLQTIGCQRIFQPDEILLLQRIADQTAIALYNAQSYERLEQTVRARTRELEEEKFLSDAANRAKSEFLANMSHELRTPLTGILGFSSVLLKQIFGPLNQKQQQYIESISSCGEHLLSLINDLLDLTKIEAGREELMIESIDVQEFCQDCMELIRERAEEQGLQTHLEIAPELRLVRADLRRLKQILLNLLSNSVKFTERGSVTLRVLRTDTRKPNIQFQVIDTGIGIAQNDISLLFQPFQQLDSGLDRRFQGTGLGLALARKLAQLHGGDITVTSTVGRGSCFTLDLPQSQTAPLLKSVC